MPYTPGGPGRPPVFEFDPTPPSGALDMFAAAAWPLNPSRQAQWQGARLLQVRELLRRPPERLRNADLSRYSHEPEPETLAQAGRNEIRRNVEDRLDGSNGWNAAAEGPGIETLTAEVLAALGGGPRRAGQLLLVIACMQEHHAELPPSLNRAIAVLEHRYVQQRQLVGANERALKQAWKEHRVIAHLWAAVELHQIAIQEMELGPLPSFLDPMHRYLVLGAAGWFREFATTYRPERARDPLIPPTEALDLKVGVEATKPSLPELPAALLAIAKNYSVKAVKQGY